MTDNKKIIRNTVVKTIIREIKPKALVEKQWLVQLADFVYRVIIANVNHTENRVFIKHFIAGTQNKGDIKKVADVPESKQHIPLIKPTGIEYKSITIPYKVTINDSENHICTINGEIALRTGLTGKELHIVVKRRLREIFEQMAGIKIVDIEIME